MEFDIAQLGEVLARWDPLKLHDFGRTPAAVLVPIVKVDGELHVLLTRRSTDLAKHPGEISFPGGRIEEHDESAYAAALREAQEEVGLQPEQCELLGRLDDAVTVTGYRIRSFVAYVREPFDLILQEAEVERALLVPLARFCRPRPSYTIYVDGRKMRQRFPLFVHRGNVIWGATARIMSNFAAVATGQDDQSDFDRVARRLLAMLRGCTRCILTTHVNPDADGLGAQVAMEELLLALGKEVVIANSDPIPAAYPSMQFRSPGYFGADIQPDIAKGADLMIVVDTAESGRMGKAAKLLKPMSGKVAVLDHHLAGNLEGPAVLVDRNFSSASEIVYHLLVVMGFPFTQRTVDALYAGILFDTHGFRYVSNRPEPFRVAGHLVDLGADASRIQEELFSRVSRGHVDVLRLSMERSQYEFDKRWAWSYINEADLDELGATTEDAGEIAPFFLSIDGVEVSTFFREVGRKRYKISFRSTQAHPIGHICRKFAGGGHANAGGATMTGTPEEIAALLREEIRLVFG